MLEKYTLYVGLNDKDSKTQEINTVDAYKIVSNLMIQMFDGATISEAQGIYKHDNGTFVTETTLRIEFLFVEKESVKKFVDILKRVLNQESIAVQHEIVDSELW